MSSTHRQSLHRLCIQRNPEPDRTQLTDIYNAARLSAGCFANAPLSPRQFQHEILDEVIITAELPGKVVGFAGFWAPDHFLHHLYVDPEFQSHGIAPRLIAHLLDLFGYPLALKCVLANKGACRFYERLGFQATGQGVGTEGPYRDYTLLDPEIQS